MSETIDLAALTAANVANGDSLLGINGNLLKKVTVGNNDESICKFFKFPSFNTLVAAGYLDEANKNKTVHFIPAVIKYLTDTYPGGGMFFGRAAPGLQGILIMHLYAGKAQNGSGFPPHGTGIFLGLSERYLFYISGGVFSIQSINTTPV